MSILIVGGIVADGSGKPGYQADVLLEGKKLLKSAG